MRSVCKQDLDLLTKTNDCCKFISRSKEYPKIIHMGRAALRTGTKNETKLRQVLARQSSQQLGRTKEATTSREHKHYWDMLVSTLITGMKHKRDF